MRLLLIGSTMQHHPSQTGRSRVQTGRCCIQTGRSRVQTGRCWPFKVCPRKFGTVPTFSLLCWDPLGIRGDERTKPQEPHRIIKDTECAPTYLESGHHCIRYGNQQPPAPSRRRHTLPIRTPSTPSGAYTQRTRHAEPVPAMGTVGTASMTLRRNRSGTNASRTVRPKGTRGPAPNPQRQLRAP